MKNNIEQCCNICSVIAAMIGIVLIAGAAWSWIHEYGVQMIRWVKYLL